MAARNPPGTGMLGLSAAILFMGAPVLAFLFGSWGVWAFLFGLGAMVLGIRQVRLREDRSDRFLWVAILLGGAFAAIEGLVSLLTGASP